MEKDVKKSNSKKPFYKQAWFWIVIVFIIVAGGGASQNAKKVGENGTKTGEVSNTASQETKTEEKTEFKVGDIIAFDGKELTVEKVERNYSTGNQFVTPKDGKEFVKVNLKVENKSDGEMSYNFLEFKIEDSNGSVELGSIMANSDDSLGSGELTKGGKKSGSIVFEVPAGSSLKLHYKPLWTTKKIVINL